MLKLNTIHHLHVLDGFHKLPDKSIDMIMTSPPYWSMRDYGKSTDSIWGGDPNCKHVFRKKDISKRSTGGSKSSQVKMHQDGVASFHHTSRFCCKCGAWKGQLGLEPTIELFIEHLVNVFDEGRRVLKDTGTCWVNLGDTYYRQSCSQKEAGKRGSDNRANEGLKPKCLSLIPFRFALAMIERGWVLRNVIIWHKPNCVPSSAQDRFTVDFDYLFLFSKSPKYYFEKQLEKQKTKPFKPRLSKHKAWDNDRFLERGKGKNSIMKYNPQGRNKRCVWAICSQPLKEAHFAVFPEELCKIPIKAGCPKQVCKKCGMPKLVITTGGNPVAFNVRVRDAKNKKIEYIDRKASKKELEALRPSIDVSEKKQRAIFQCGCHAGYKPGVVLDPFTGSGTTALVAEKTGCDYLGFELNPEYLEIARNRLKQDGVKQRT